MAKRQQPTKRGADALDLMDKQFGVGPQAEAFHEQFTEQADIAEMLFAAREAAGLTQRELAKLAGTTQQVISQLENADYEGHSTSILRRIATALNSRLEIRLVPIGTRTR